MRFALIEMDVPARSGLTREGHAHARGSMEGMQEEFKGVRARDEAAVRRRPHKPDVNHQGEDSASLNRCSAVAARVGPGFGSARRHG